MADVVQFPDRADGPSDHDYLWICPCGCVTFEVRGDGSFVCANCAETSDVDQGGWFKQGEPEIDCAEERVVRGNDPDDIRFLRQRISRMVLEEDTCGVVVIRQDGGITFMEDACTDDRKSWYRRRLNQAKKMLGRR